jgi:demethylmenaquinone methyltransferase/2-methoxy-6-polyprenyl-1,4-benzoquinol methylase
MMRRQPDERRGPLPAPEEKETFVRTMFSDIAGRYDLMNRLMTFGRDQAWRRYTVSRLALPHGARTSILDVATGTGDLALEVRRQWPQATVVGVDFVPDMLAQARGKLARREESGARVGVHLVTGDALHLPFPRATFDGVVTGFALRNVVDIPAAFAEIARVTRPGAQLACLEITRPRLPLFRDIYRWYFYRMVPVIGGLVAGTRTAYTYLPHSVAEFLSPEEIAVVMQDTGWRDVTFRRLTLGTVAVHVGVRAG